MASAGTRDNPSPCCQITFSLFLWKIQPTGYIRIATLSWGMRKLGWLICLASAGRVTLASGTTLIFFT